MDARHLCLLLVGYSSKKKKHHTVESDIEKRQLLDNINMHACMDKLRAETNVSKSASSGVSAITVESYP